MLSHQPSALPDQKRTTHSQMTASIWKSTLTGHATSRFKYLPTRTEIQFTSGNANAQYNGATRSSSRNHHLRPLMKRLGLQWELLLCGWPNTSDIPVPGPLNTCLVQMDSFTFWKLIPDCRSNIRSLNP